MQPQVREPVKESALWRVVFWRVRLTFGSKRKGAPKAKPVAPQLLPDSVEQARATPSPRQQAEIRAHRTDWP